MSFQALNWATRLVIGSSTAKFVLMALANYADDEGMCFPSVSMLMGDTELSKRAVSAAIKTLCDKGLLTTERQRNEDGSLGRNRYRLQLSRTAPLADDADEKAANRQEPGAPNAHGEEADNQVHLVPSPGAPHDQPGACGAPPIDEPPIEPPSEPSTLRESARARAHGDGKGGQTESTEPVPQNLGPDFDSGFWRKWFNRGIDSKTKARAAYDRLSADEKRAAIAGIKPYKANMDAAGRKKIPAAMTYLAEKKWEDQDSEPDAGGKYMPPFAKVWSPLWMANLIELVHTGDAWKAACQLNDANRGASGGHLRFGRKRNDELVALCVSFEKVGTHQERWQRWAAWLEREITANPQREGRMFMHVKQGRLESLARMPTDPDRAWWLSLPSDAIAAAWGIDLPELHPPPNPISEEDAAEAFN